MQRTNWIENFPGLNQLELDMKNALIAASREISIPEGTPIFGPGQIPDNFLLLLEGTVRVHQVSESGREIVLYRATAGESCALTTACLMGYEKYPAEGIAESQVRAVAIPNSTLDSLIATSPAFRRFLFNAFSVRITSLLQVIEDVAFSRIDIRLAQRLLELEKAGARVAATHQQLASELGSAREVISRQLTEFQRRSWIKMSRGSIDIVSHEELKKLAGTR